MLLPELRAHPGGLSPLFLIKMKFGKSDFDCILIKVVFGPIEASLMPCQFWLIAKVLSFMYFYIISLIYFYKNSGLGFMVILAVLVVDVLPFRSFNQYVIV